MDAEVKSDIEIAQACAMKPIRDIAAVAGVDEEYLEYYGKYKAKIDLKLLSDRADRRVVRLHFAPNRGNREF